MTAFLVRPPAVEPVSLAQAKAQLRLDHDAEDDLVAALIPAARGLVELKTRRALIDQGWRIALDRWPRRGAVRLSPLPVVSVDAVTVYDGEGAPHVLAADEVEVDLAGGRLVPCSAARRPGRAVNGIEIDLGCGYGETADAVPEALRQAVLMLVAHWFEVREAASLGVIASPVALGFEALVAPYRAVRL
jgi:uncharacterized phiE125 gp8 family phage protein